MRFRSQYTNVINHKGQMLQPTSDNHENYIQSMNKTCLQVAKNDGMNLARHQLPATFKNTMPGVSTIHPIGWVSFFRWL